MCLMAPPLPAGAGTSTGGGGREFITVDAEVAGGRTGRVRRSGGLDGAIGCEGGAVLSDCDQESLPVAVGAVLPLVDKVLVSEAKFSKSGSEIELKCPVDAVVKLDGTGFGGSLVSVGPVFTTDF